MSCPPQFSGSNPCFHGMDNFKALVKAKGGQDRFVGLSLSQDGLAEYLHAHDLTIPVLTGLSSETVGAYKLGRTSQTLVVSPQGRIVQNWMGAWTDKTKSEVEAFFHVSLPGLQLSPNKPT